MHTPNQTNGYGTWPIALAYDRGMNRTPPCPDGELGDCIQCQVAAADRRAARRDWRDIITGLIILLAIGVALSYFG